MTRMAKQPSPVHYPIRQPCIASWSRRATAILPWSPAARCRPHPPMSACRQFWSTTRARLRRSIHHMRSMVMNNRTVSPSLRLSATLLLVGQLLYIVVTQFHTGGDANTPPAIFAAYAGSGIWTAVHLGQFAATAILIAGLLALSFALDVQAGTARWAGRLGAASAVATLALYGVLQAVDGGRAQAGRERVGKRPGGREGGAL